MEHHCVTAGLALVNSAFRFRKVHSAAGVQEQGKLVEKRSVRVAATLLLSRRNLL